jgi:V/A-type H+-transporting ATPase subunit B
MQGSLVALEGVKNVTYDELAELTLDNGERRYGRIIRIDGEKVVMQVFEGTDGIDMEHINTRFTGKPVTLSLSKEILGRIFDGTGKPLDGLREVFPEERRDINGSAINPVARQYPRSCILTGISSIDATATLIRGQKLPIFSGAGMSHNELAAQIVRQARTGD